jgi:hypothetical protein
VVTSFKAIAEISTNTVSAFERLYKETFSNDLPSLLIDAVNALAQRPQLPPAPVQHVQDLFSQYLATQIKVLSIILAFIKQAPNIVRSHGPQVCWRRC